MKETPNPEKIAQMVAELPAQAELLNFLDYLQYKYSPIYQCTKDLGNLVEENESKGKKEESRALRQKTTDQWLNSLADL